MFAKHDMNVTLVERNKLVYLCLKSGHDIALKEHGLKDFASRITVVHDEALEYMKKIQEQDNLAQEELPHVVFVEPAFRPHLKKLNFSFKKHQSHHYHGYYEDVEFVLRNEVGQTTLEEVEKLVKAGQQFALHKVVLALPKRKPRPQLDGYVCTYRDKFMAYHVYKAASVQQSLQSPSQEKTTEDSTN